MKVVWLASYPRSGNTWLRFLLYNYFWGEPSHSSQVALRIPDLHKVQEREPALELGLRENVSRMLIKTHAPLLAQHPLLNYTAGFVYLMRHPRDVLLSLINYHALSNEEAIEFARQFIRTGTDPIIPEYGPWADHVASWMGSKPKVVLRYNTMRADAKASLGSVLDFLGETYEQADLERAVAACDFARMRQAEIREAEKGAESGIFALGRQSPAQARAFVHKGLVGGALANLAPDLDALFNERFGAAIRQWGLDQAPSST